MSLLDAGKVCTFSHVVGTVTLNGQPVKNALVKRSIDWKSKFEDSTKTDDSGWFELPELSERSISKFTFTEIVITQKIIVEYDDKDYIIWLNTKMNAEANSELGGAPLKLTCELTDEPIFYEDFGPLLETNCKWKKQ